MKRYFSIYLSFIKVGFIADMEYRSNFIFRVLTDIIWFVAQIGSFQVLYNHTKILGEWNIDQTMVFLGVLFVVDGLYMIMLYDNLDGMTERVRKGELDLLLAKPINSQFMVSLQKVSTSLITNLFIGTGLLVWAIARLPNFDFMRLLWLFLMVPCGLSALYSFRFMLAATSVIFTKSDNLQFVFYQVYRLGMRPDRIYAPWLRAIFMSILPVALIASVPARTLLDPPDFYLFAWTAFWCALLFWFSTRFWKFALKFYSSASS